MLRFVISLRIRESSEYRNEIFYINMTR